MTPREKQMNLRLSLEEWRAVGRAARAAGMTRSAWTRALIRKATGLGTVELTPP